MTPKAALRKARRLLGDQAYVNFNPIRVWAPYSVGRISLSGIPTSFGMGHSWEEAFKQVQDSKR